MKICNKCGVEKSFDHYHKNKRHKFGYANTCSECRSKLASEYFKENWFTMTCNLKRSWCKSNQIPFDLTSEFLKDIWTETCPVFGKTFERHDKTSSWCPALDRIDPTKGYVKGNVMWISSRANRIKYDATLDELKSLVLFLEGATTIPSGSTLK